MDKIRKLAKRLLAGKEVTLYRDRINHGTKSNPDIAITRVYAVTEIDRIFNEYRDIVVYLSKEDDKTIYDVGECYRFPHIKDLNLLEKLLEEAAKQSRCTF